MRVDGRTIYIEADDSKEDVINAIIKIPGKKKTEIKIVRENEDVIKATQKPCFDKNYDVYIEGRSIQYGLYLDDLARLAIMPKFKNRELRCGDLRIICDEYNLENMYERARELQEEFGAKKIKGRKNCRVSGNTYLEKVEELIKIANDFMNGHYGHEELKDYLYLDKKKRFTGKVSPIYTNGVTSAEREDSWLSSHTLALCVIADECDGRVGECSEIYLPQDPSILTDSYAARLCINTINTTSRPRMMLNDDGTLNDLKAKPVLPINGSDAVQGCVYQDAKGYNWMYLNKATESVQYSRNPYNPNEKYHVVLEKSDGRFIERPAYMKINKTTQKIYDECSSLTEFIQKARNSKVMVSMPTCYKSFVTLIDSKFKEDMSKVVNITLYKSY